MADQKIYIAYEIQARSTAIEIYQRLKSTYRDVWIDQRNLHGEDNWNDEIEKAINACDLFIVVMSGSVYNPSKNVARECRAAIGKKILPIVTSLPGSLFSRRAREYRITHLQATMYNTLEMEEDVKRLLK